MADTVTVTSRLIDPNTGDGVQLSDLTVEVKNQLLEVQETLTYPAGITQVITGSDYAYKITDYDVTDKDKFPGTYVIFAYEGIDLATGSTTTWNEIIGVGTSFTPTVPEGREPYEDIAGATAFFQTRLDWDDWAQLAVPDPNVTLRALIMASDDIDREKFKGRKYIAYAVATEFADRQFPRIYDDSEMLASSVSGVIPGEIKNATVLQALYLLKQRKLGHDIDGRYDLQMQGLTGITRGNNSESWDLASARHHRITQEAYHYMKPFLAMYCVDNPGSL